MTFLFRRGARGNAGFMLAPLLYMLALAGIGAAVLYSSYSQILRSNAQITANNAARAQLQSAGTTLAASSVLDNATSTIVQPPAVYAFGSVAGGDVAKLPSNYTNAGTTGSPHDVGVIDPSAGVRQLDPWGKFYVYCRWENAVSSPASPSIMVISAGPDGNLDTKCGDTIAQGDDKIIASTVAETINRANVWQVNSSSQIKYGLAANPVLVNASGSMQAAMLTLGNATAATNSGQLSAVSANISGALTAGSTTFTGATITGNETVGGTLGVTGAATFSSTLAAGATSLSSLTLTTPLAVAQGGTGATTAAVARADLGSTTVGDAVFVAATTTAAQTALGGTAVGEAVFTAATTSAAQTAIGGTTLGETLFTEPSAAQARTDLGLGTMATQNANAVAITGGSITGVTFTGNITGNASGSAGSVAATGVTGCCVAISAGGTNAGDAATARSNLGTNDAGNLTTGRLNVLRLPTSGVVSGTYTQVTVDAYGRVTVGANVNSSQWTNSGSNIYFNTGNVSIGTTVANTELNVYNASSATLTDFTQALTKGAINVLTNYTANNYTPGVFWSATDDNATLPKAGIWLKEAAAGTTMYLGTSNAYATGITNQALSIDYNGVVTAAAGFVGNITGNVTGNVTGNITGVISISDGTVSSPGLYFTNETNTGIYRPAAKNFAITAYGSDVARFIGTGTIQTSAANYFTLSNATAGNAVTISAAGTDTNIGIALTPKGSGNLNLTTGAYQLNGNNGVAEQDSGNTTVVGNTAASGNTNTGKYTTAVGYQAFNASATGANNTAIGAQALTSDTTGGNDTAIGYQALYTNNSGNFNTAVGAQSLYTASNGGGSPGTAAVQNTALGYQSMYGTTYGSRNVAVGYQSMYSSTIPGNALGGAPAPNVALGHSSLYTNTTGGGLTAIGFKALYTANAGVLADYSTAVGYQALASATTGTANTGLGGQAGYDVTTGSNNIFVGAYPTTGVGITTGSNNILIGYNLQKLTNTSSNQLDIGNLIFATGLASGATLSTGSVGVGVITPNHTLDVNGNIGMAASSYLNWGATDGTTGYGIRDNSGTIEIKNSGGSWAAPLTASSTITANNFAAGSVGAPGLYVVGDSDTGFYSPAANTLSVTTGGVEVMRWNTIASGVNYFNVTPSATGNKITLGAAGTDTDIGINITPKGAGNVAISGSGTNQLSVTTTTTTGASSAVSGNASGTSGAIYGGIFQTASSAGIGVYGYGSSGTGSNYGGYFQSASTRGVSLYSVAGNAATKGLVVAGAASQTGDLTEWQNNSGTVLAKVDASGNINAAGLSVNGTPALTANQTITLTGDVTGSGTTSIATTIAAGHVTNAMLAGSIDLTSKVTGALPVGNGGTGDTTLTSNGVLYGNTTSAVQVTAQGAANSVLTANAGAPSFSAAPTIGTSVTTPLLIGGTAASSTLTLESTSGVGTSDYIAFKTASQSERMRIDTSGNVGIGTTAPSQLLHVYSKANPANGYNGQLQVGGNLNTTNDIYLSVGVSQSSAYAFLQAADANVGTEPIILEPQGGNVGIGTTSPTNIASQSGITGARFLNLYDNTTSEDFRLAIQGNSSAKIDMVHLGAGADAKWMQIYNAGGALTFRSVKDDGSALVTNNILVLQNSNGNVGIGYTGPSEKLAVNGNVAIGDTSAHSTGQLYVANANPTVFIDATTNPGTATITLQGRAAATHDVNLAANSAGLFTVTPVDFGSAALAINQSGNVGIGTTGPGTKLQVNTTSQTTDGLTLAASDSHSLTLRPSNSAGAANGLVQAGDTAIIYSNGSSGTGALVIGPWGTGGIRMDASSDVGLAASSYLNFGTTLGSSGYGMRDNAGTIEFKNSGGSWGPPTAAASGAAGYVQFSNGSALSSDSTSGGQFFWDSTNHRLGLGTTTPGYPLDVRGSAAGTGNILAKNTSATGYSGLEIVDNGGTLQGRMGYDNANSKMIINSQNNSLRFQIGGTDYVTLNTSGNLGIGTASPGSKLEVNGQLNQYGGFGYIGSVNSQSYPTANSPSGTPGLAASWNFTGGSGETDLWNTYTPAGTAFSFKQLTGASSRTDIMTLLANGNVGIGNTSPGELLQISDNATNGDHYLKIGTNGGSAYHDGIKLHVFSDNYGFDIVNDDTLTNGVRGLNFVRHENSAGGASSLWLDRADGNVGIGTTSPGDKFTIHLATDSNVGVATNTYAGLFSHNDAWSAWGNLQLNNSMYLLSNGNVGIGQTSPNAKLDISSNGGSDGIVIYQQTDNTETIQTYIDGHWSDRTTYAGGCCNVLALQPDVGVVGIGTVSPAYKLDVNGVGQFAGGTQIGNGPQGYYGDGTNLAIRAYNSGSSDIYFQTYSGAATNMIIKNGGNVGIGNASPQQKLDVSGYISTHGGLPAAASGTMCYNNTLGYDLIGFCSSDIRLKKNIEYLEGSAGLDTVMKLKPTKFVLRGSEDHKAGFIAQDVAKALSVAAYIPPHSKYYSIDTTAILGYVTRAVQELKHLFDGLATEVKQLAARVDEAFTKLAAHDGEIRNLKDENKNLEDENKELRAAVCKLDAAAVFCHPLKTGRSGHPAGAPPRADNDNLPRADNDNLSSRELRRAANER
jgi:hypothetical protein